MIALRRLSSSSQRGAVVRAAASLGNSECVAAKSKDVEMIAANHRLEVQVARHRYTCRAFSTTSTTTTMKDEYGSMDNAGHTFTAGNYKLESGQVLKTATLTYQTYGQLNAQRTNVLVVCHALTGNASLHAWWGDLLGPGRAFDTDKYFVVCCTILGSCYGSTSPTSLQSDGLTKYGMNFPDVSVQDTVRLQLQLLKEQLRVNSIQCVIGGSFGGMQAVEFAAQAGTSDTPFLKSVIPIACGKHHTAWQIAISEVQRQAIYKDAMFATDPFQATAGLEIARQMGMISYRTATGYKVKFARETTNNTNTTMYGANANWKVKGYLEYQGSKFLTRFDPVTYIKLTEQMDSHDVARGRDKDVLKSVLIPALVLGIDSDLLYPLDEQRELVDAFGNGRLGIIHSEDGHDGFLLEQEQVGAYIREFLELHSSCEVP
jgi:homoserine O-acetyltransferase